MNPSAGSVEPTRAPIEASDADMKAACEWAMSYARKRARGSSEVEELLVDAATDALMWARKNCKDASTFVPLAKAATRRWFGRALHRLKLRRANRPQFGELTAGTDRARATKPTRPTLIEELPEDLAFIARLYTIDAYSIREIALLTGKSHSTVHIALHKAAELLAGGRERPIRKAGTKCLSAG
ncbi:rna polymerase subunit sigma-24 : : Sigma70_r4_2 [Gemmata massiliana]|uniref:Rna polymerase subunit sigma-24:: Sigma70_r4_2 n=1 Tax=Gemmata massiliana TaxID=1210884 RepID=A0A6P2CUF6_9BACT|nr:sigma-70 family RNA polymerase sigma factor [Gemmata massiliana]VTR90820.1 rna polymerase subunit sigma-24 : : Sigma70_r4_2 [Gemmata massiliana]